MSKTNKNPLGRGLESLLPTNFNKDLVVQTDERIQKLLINDVSPNSDQPRKHFDPVALGELADSIKQFGVLQPIIVAPKGEKYEIIAGERRWRASQIAGLDKIPAIIRDKADLEKLEIALIENVQRVDLSPLEQATSIEYLHDQFNLSYQAIALKLGKAVPTVNNIVRLLQLPTAAREALQAKRITEGHARALLSLKEDPEVQHRLLELIQGQGWSVRQAEQFVTAHKEGVATKVAVRERAVRETPQTMMLAKKIGTKVTIHHTAKGGRLEIHFASDEELEDLYKKLG